MHHKHTHREVATRAARLRPSPLSARGWDRAALPGLGIKPLAGTSAAQIATLALADTAEGQAYRYALYKLNPFVVTSSSALYDGINAHNELKLYTHISNTGRFTEQYLKDRAAMLSWKLEFGFNDVQPVGDTFVKLRRAEGLIVAEIRSANEAVWRKAA